MLFLLVYRPSKNLTNEVSSHTYCLAVKLHVESCYRPATDPTLSPLESVISRCLSFVLFAIRLFSSLLRKCEKTQLPSSSLAIGRFA